jgi:hypothetical protein
MGALIYDLEIVKAIQGKGEAHVEDIDYCEGWDDHANMGISVLCAYDYDTARFRVFTESNITEFLDLAMVRRPLVSFNGIRFDNRVIRAVCGADAVPNTLAAAEDAVAYDILLEMWRAAGLGRDFQFNTHGGFKLDTVMQVNFGLQKTGHGGKAPIDWQQGKIGDVIDYCLEDVRLTKRLYDMISYCGFIRDPRNPSKVLVMPKWRPQQVPEQQEGI